MLLPGIFRCDAKISKVWITSCNEVPGEQEICKCLIYSNFIHKKTDPISSIIQWQSFILNYIHITIYFETYSIKRNIALVDPPPLPHVRGLPPTPFPMSGFCLPDSSVADPKCLSRILIFTHPDPGSRIQKQQQKRRMKNFFLSYLFLKTQISQHGKLFYFWNVEEKNLSQFSKNYRTFYPKNCH